MVFLVTFSPLFSAPPKSPLLGFWLVMDLPSVAHAHKVRVKVFDGSAHISHIQRRDLFHLLVSQDKIPDIKVLQDPLLVGGFGDNGHASLNIPPQDQLAYGLLVSPGDAF